LVLQQYIQEILFRQHTCCLPQLGVFKLTHTPARYDVTNKTISPPGEIITFEETLTNDGGLVEWISQKELLVPAIAQLKMEKYIDDFRQLLKKGEPVVIPGVGKLLANAVGRISFEQEPPAITRDVLHVSPVIRQDASHKVTVGTKEVVNKQVVDHLTASPSSSSSSSPASTHSSTSSASSIPPAASSDQGVKPPATTAAATEDYEYEGYTREIPSRLRWLWIAIPVASVATAVIVWYSVNKNRPQITRAESALNPAPVEAVPAPKPPAVDSSSQAAAATPAAPATLEYDVVFETFKNKKAGLAKYKTRKNVWGQPVVLDANNDSTLFMLGEHFNTLPADTVVMKDSVAKKYGVTKVFLVNSPKK
jgi:nucleoid DNA-binding protein